jgi:biopolymer transport protein ExbD
MSVRIDKGRLGTGLEMTSMIDIVFLLMIFFLVASKLDEADRSIDVVLPHASAARPLTSRPREFVVNIDREGKNAIHKHVVGAMNACVEAGIENYQVQSAADEESGRRGSDQ